MIFTKMDINNIKNVSLSVRLEAKLFDVGEEKMNFQKFRIQIKFDKIRPIHIVN